MKIHSLPTSIDLSKCILWQYQNATRLQQLVQMMQDGTEMATVDLWKKAFYIFDLDKPILQTDSDYQYRVYGLHSLSNLFGIKRPSWTSGGLSALVSIDVWRRYLKGMIWLMDSDGSADDINKWLSVIFPNTTSYILDNLDMSITYKFYPVPAANSEEWQLLHIDGFLPHPAGVLAAANLTNTDEIFGTDGQNAGQLNSSRFGSAIAIYTLNMVRTEINACVDLIIQKTPENPFSQSDKIATNATPANIVTLFNKILTDAEGYDFSILSALSTSSMPAEISEGVRVAKRIIEET